MTVVALVHLKGGVGKTTLAVNLAHAAAAQGPTLLWDLDPQGAASYAFRIEPRVPGGMRELLAGGTPVSTAIKGTDFPGLDLLPADLGARRLDVLLRGGEGGLTALLRALAGEYRHVVLDCPPGISNLFESVAAGSDVLLVPTPPTTFAIRALAPLMKSVRELPPPRPMVLAVSSMVDASSELQRTCREWCARQRWLFLQTEVPLSTRIERMTVERAPVAAFAPGSPEAEVWGGLWDELAERAARAAPPRGGLKRSVRELLTRLDPQAVGEAPRSAATTDGRECELKLALRDESDVGALLEALGPEVPASEATHLDHLFDTEDGALWMAGLALRLRERHARFVLTAKGPREQAAEAARFDRAEEELEIDGPAAREILLGRRCPLDTLRRGAGTASPLLAAIAARVGAGSLRRAGLLATSRRRLGPLELAAPGEPSLPVVLELDRTQLPDGHCEHQLEVEVAPADAERCAQAVRRLLERAGLPWIVASSKSDLLMRARSR